MFGIKLMNSIKFTLWSIIIILIPTVEWDKPECPRNVLAKKEHLPHRNQQRADSVRLSEEVDGTAISSAQQQNQQARREYKTDKVITI